MTTTTTTTTTTVRTETTGPAITRVALLIDESESMLGIKETTISTVNEYMSTLRSLPGQVFVSLVFFNSVNSHRVVYRDRPVSEATAIGRDDYRPAGMTPLYDAVGKTVYTMELEGAGMPPTKVLFVIQTDGMENNSQEFKTAESIAALVKAREAQGWTFLYLGADLSRSQATHAAMQMGIRSANTQSYDKGATRETFMSLSGGTRNFHTHQQPGSASADFWHEHGRADALNKKSSQ